MLRAPIWPSPKIFGRRLPCAITVSRVLHLDGVNGTAMRITRSLTNQSNPNYKDEPLLKSLDSNSSSGSSDEQDVSSTKISDETTLSQVESSNLRSSQSISSTPAESTSGSPLPNSTQRPRRLFRKFLITTLSLGLTGFIGGVFYSRENDNFHDFFTEYVPFGEQAVLYLEEREYRKRFSNKSSSASRDLGQLTSIPRNSGVSWRVAEGLKPGSSGRYADATDPDVKPLQSPAEEKTKKVEDSNKENTAIPSQSPEKTSSKSQLTIVPDEPVTSKTEETSKSEVLENFVAPEVDEPSRFPPQSMPTQSISIEDPKEPLVQDLVKIVNEILKVIEVKSVDSKFYKAIEKAKAEISALDSKIQVIKNQAQKEADIKIQSEKEDFDRAAKELLRRIEVEMQNEQANWREEYQNEREKLQRTYEKRLELELQRTKELHEQHLRNALLEQALEMKKQFGKEIKDCVEEERNGRFKKISELSNNVAELEKLATKWNSVLDYNLKTQKLHVALEATRVFLENSDVPRPFVRELVALREVASEDPLVNAAIASINPTAYHQGIQSSAQIIDRFRRVSNEVRKVALLPVDAGVASQASSYILSKFLFQKKGLANGDDVESILARAETFLEEGDLDSAAREVNGLKGWAKTLSRDWLDEVRKVLEVRQALDVIATEARLKTLTIE
ncbi:MICOS complex subunit MIC60 [Golovinomyces cichoracearum]|uniref:MICOS complex subunit MIC60 n=1 Tax=Golovinomyces cichoracearum TaxID=62708 RepID=A0A420J766_9PEZI|nr:MICOS complex subunit MIC60 [Golovinomyces cichoracearum]